MSIRAEIEPFLTIDGYVCPNKVPPFVIVGCDNQNMFTSEYYIMLNRNQDLVITDISDFLYLVNRSMDSSKELQRYPGGWVGTEIDDYLGVLAACNEFHIRPFFKLPIRLWRFPQLVYAYLMGKGVPSYLVLPLSIYNGIILATACINKDPKDSDSRRLTWHLWQATKQHSFLSAICGAFWHWRQKKVYKTEEVMKEVAKIYYRDNHPFQRYWVD